jgi:purine-nucleoside phosphorylase
VDVHSPIAETAARFIRKQRDLRPELAIVLGSGFAHAATVVEDASAFPFAAIPGFVPVSVPGHQGVLLLGTLAGLPVVVLSGRLHYYEGHDLDTVTFPIRVMAALGARAVLLTNAAGGIRPDLAPGSFVVIRDHLNMMGVHPLRGARGDSGFIDLTDAYAPALRRMAQRAGELEDIHLKDGVYAAVSGPSYETPAEIRALAALGADLVGMSTVPETIVARQLGLRVVAVSCVTNRAAGLGAPIQHEEVLRIGRQTASQAAALLRRFAELYASSLASGIDQPDS